MGNRVTVAPHVIADLGVQKAYGRIQNVQEGSAGIVYQIGVWTADGYLILDDISEEQLDYFQG